MGDLRTRRRFSKQTFITSSSSAGVRRTHRSTNLQPEYLQTDDNHSNIRKLKYLHDERKKLVFRADLLWKKKLYIYINEISLLCHFNRYLTFKIIDDDENAHFFTKKLYGRKQWDFRTLNVCKKNRIDHLLYYSIQIVWERVTLVSEQ